MKGQNSYKRHLALKCVMQNHEVHLQGDKVTFVNQNFCCKLTKHLDKPSGEHKIHLVCKDTNMESRTTKKVF